MTCLSKSQGAAAKTRETQLSLARSFPPVPPPSRQNSKTPQLGSRGSKSPDPRKVIAGNLDSNLPLFNVASYNVGSMQAGSVSKHSHYHTHINNIRSLLATHHIVHILETRFAKDDQHTLQLEFPNHHIFYNNLSSRSAGTATLVGSTIARELAIEHNIVDPGYTAYIHLTPLPGSKYTACARYFAIYLATGNSARNRKRTEQTLTNADDTHPNNNDTPRPHDDDQPSDEPDDTPTTYTDDIWKIRERQIKQLKRLERQDLSIYSGDWNFVSSPEDTQHPKTTSYYRIPSSFQKTWDKFTEKHELTEIPQNLHTRYQFNTKDGQLRSSSRLDRHYTSLSEALCELVSQKCCIPNIPFGISQALRSFKFKKGSKQTAPFRPKTFPTDHTPVSLTFQKIQLAGRGYRCPEWAVMHPRFPDEVLKMYEHDENPYIALRNLNTAIVTASKTIARNHKSRLTQPYEILTYATKLLRIITSPHTSSRKLADAFISSHPHLGKYKNAAGEIDRRALEKEIDKLLESQKVNSAPTAISKTSKSTKTKSEKKQTKKGRAETNKYKNFLQNASDSLPFQGARFDTMRPTLHQPTTDVPKQMAKMSAKFWKHIWQLHTTGTTGTTAYLETYDRPPIEAPDLPTLQEVEAQITNSKNTSPGPNGVPFAAYRALQQHGGATSPGKLIFQVMLALQGTSPPPKDFNRANLSLFPKDDTFHVGQARPIAVNNTDNRIIASTLRASIHDKLKDYLHPEQTGFLKGKDIRTNIRFFNEKYYTAVENHTPYTFFLFDFCKAFDSVSHEFIFALLEKIGLPKWFNNSFKNLLTGVALNVNQWGDFGCCIPVHRGVKQGCPLSPLIFDLVMDVLIHHLKQLPNPPDLAAYADDLGLGTTKISQYADIAKVFVDFGTHSGLQLNQGKTKVLLAREIDTQRARKQLDRIKWKKVPVSDSGVYLGVLFGRKVDLYDIYREAYNKLNRRLRALIAIRHRYSIPKRVIICNVFVFPTLSFLYNFFCIPKDFYDELYSNLSVYLTPFQGAYPWPILTNPKGFFSLRTPLACIHSRAYAALASQNFTESDPGPVPLKTFNESFRITTHMQVATNFVFQMATVVPAKKNWSAANLYRAILNGFEMRCTMENTIWTKVRNWGLLGPKHDPLINDTTDDTHDDDLDTDNTHTMTLRTTTRRKTHASITRDLTAQANKDSMTLAQQPIDYRLHLAQCNHNAIARSLPAHIHYYQLAILYNAHTTAQRVNWFQFVRKRGAHAGPHVKPGDLCCLCGNAVDGLPHLFNDCTPVREAEYNISQKHSITWPEATTGRLTLLADFADARSVNLLVVFHYSVLTTRRQTLKGYHNGSKSAIIEQHFDNLAVRYIKSLLGTPRVHIKGKGRASEAAVSDKRKKTAQRMGWLIEAAEAEDLLAYTDGSHNTITNRTGAGYTLIRGGTDGVPVKRMAFFLHNSTNNEAELFAIGACIDALVSLYEAGSIDAFSRIVIFTDSEYAYQVLHQASIPGTSIRLIHHIFRKLKHLTSLVLDTTILWLPGHLAITGNEDADYNAKHGVTLGTSDHTQSVISRVLDNPDDFNTHGYDMPLSFRTA